MGFLSRLFGSSYADDKLVAAATKAINSDTHVHDPSTLLVSSKNGVVTLAGIVSKEQEKGRIEGVVQEAITNANLKHDSLVNELKIPHG